MDNDIKAYDTYRCKTFGEKEFADTNKDIHHYINNLKELTKKLRLFRISISLDSNAAMPLFMFTELLDIFFLHSATNKTLAFDYKIKKGTANEGNAIKILGLYGYPDYITKEAEKIRNFGTFTGSEENK